MRTSLIASGMVLAGLLLITLPVQAETINTQADTKTIAQNTLFEKDPVFMTWAAVLAPQPEQPKELSAYEKTLAKWKAKQSHLWTNLPEGPFTINASAYTAAADECGKDDGITASGIKVTENRTLACPPSYPFGVKIKIAGYGIYTCEDRGGAIKGNKFDIYMATKKQAFAFGRRHLVAEVVLD